MLLIIGGTIISEEPFWVFEGPRFQRELTEWRDFACRRPRLQVSELCRVVRGTVPHCMRVLPDTVDMSNEQGVGHKAEEPRVPLFSTPQQSSSVSEISDDHVQRNCTILRNKL